MVLVIGDIAFLHDLGGLCGVMAGGLRLKIILINNNGGGIFSHLPIARHERVFDSLVAMPHGLDLAHASRLYDIPHRCVRLMSEFREAYASCFARPGPEIIEVQTDRQRTVAMHQGLCRRVCASVAAEVQSPPH